MSSRFATERVVLAQDDLVDPRSGKRSGCSWNGGMARRQRRDFTATTLPANMSRRQLVRRVKQRWRTERVYEDAKGELGLDHYEAAPSAAGTTMCPWCWFASRLSSPSAPGLFPLGRKLPRGKRRIVTTVRTATRPSGTSGISFITVRVAVARVLATWLPRCPLCHRPAIVMDRLVHIAREHRRTTPFWNQ